MSRRAALALVPALVACHASSPHRASTIRDCTYDVEVFASGRVHVDAACRADGAVTFRVAHGFSKSCVSGAGRAREGKLSYDVDLAELAKRSKHFDRALRVGDSFVAPMSSVLLVPEPLTTEIEVKVRVRAAAPVTVSVGLARDSAPDTYRLYAHEIPVATYFSFGVLEQRALDVDGARVEVTRLDGELTEPFDEVSRWIQASAHAVRDFYGAFPVPRASVTVIPVPDRDSVVFGKVLPESAPGVALLLGQRATSRELSSDWILVHELFHLGFPSFFEEGKWLDEGLATYFEPIIRVRAGSYSERELWDELSSSMWQGLPAFTQTGLEQARDFRGVYWGGAIACLLADVRARQRQRAKGLEVGLRALREAGGNACEVWSRDDAIAVIDRTLGAPTLAPITAAHATRGSPFDLDGLFRDLGVTRDASGNVALSDDAPLSAVRRAITAEP